MALPVPFTTKIIYDGSSKDAPYVAYCPELDVSSCGSTADKAREMLSEAIEITVSEAAKDGTLGDYLQLVGYQKVGKKMTFPRIILEQSYFSLPDKYDNNFQWQV